MGEYEEKVPWIFQESLFLLVSPLPRIVFPQEIVQRCKGGTQLWQKLCVVA